jgi:hypothetical protein
MPHKTPLEVLSTPDAMTFVAELAERVTIAARGAYDGDNGPDLPRLKAANETMHAITAKLIGLSRGTERFPDEDFLRSIRERAGEAFGPDLEWAISEALRAVSRTAAKT